MVKEATYLCKLDVLDSITYLNWTPIFEVCCCLWFQAQIPKGMCLKILNYMLRI